MRVGQISHFLKVCHLVSHCAGLTPRSYFLEIVREPTGSAVFYIIADYRL